MGENRGCDSRLATGPPTMFLARVVAGRRRRLDLHLYVWLYSPPAKLSRYAQTWSKPVASQGVGRPRAVLVGSLPSRAVATFDAGPHYVLHLDQIEVAGKTH